MNNAEKRQIEIRTKIIQELSKLSEDLSFGKPKVQPNEDAQTYGLLIALISSAFIIWFSGKPGHDFTIILGLFGASIGGLLIFAGVVSLADKMRRSAKYCEKFILTKFGK